MTYGQPPSNDTPGVPPPPPSYGAPAPNQSGYGSSPAPGYGAPQQSPPGYGAYGAVGGAPGYAGPGQPGYGGAPWAGHATARPGSVTGGSVLAIIGGSFAMLLSIVFFIIGSMGDSQELADAGLPAGSAALFAGIGVIVLAIGVLVLTFGIFALKGRYWAAIGLAVIGAIWALLSVISLIQGQGGVTLGLIWVGISVGMLMSPNSRAWFRTQR